MATTAPSSDGKSLLNLLEQRCERGRRAVCDACNGKIRKIRFSTWGSNDEPSDEAAVSSSTESPARNNGRAALEGSSSRPPFKSVVKLPVVDSSVTGHSDDATAVIDRVI